MPPVQQTAIFASIKEDKVQYINATKLEVVTAALMELSSAVTCCSIPSKEELLNASNVSNWNAPEITPSTYRLYGKHLLWFETHSYINYSCSNG
jgi:hypothetical protein